MSNSETKLGHPGVLSVDEMGLALSIHASGEPIPEGTPAGVAAIVRLCVLDDRLRPALRRNRESEASLNSWDDDLND